MYESRNSFKLPTLDQRNSKPVRTKKERSLGGCLTTGILLGVIGLGSCTALTIISSQNYYDFKMGPVEIAHKLQNGDHTATSEFDLFYAGSSCFFDTYWQNGHVVHSPTILTMNVGNSSVIIDPNLFGCP